MTTWTIAGCGPSLDWSTATPEGTLICVNRAIQGAPRCDFWCCIDYPNAEHSQCVEDARRTRPVVLTQRKRFRRWSAWESLELRCQEEPAHDAKNWVQSQRRTKDKKKAGPRYSIMSAISWAVDQGAEELHFIGADLKGRGYHTGEPAREAKTPNKLRWKKRWTEGSNQELDQIRRVYHSATKRGIRIVGLPDHATCLPSEV